MTTATAERAQPEVGELTHRQILTILVGLRRLLGTAWPFSDLRNLLGSQPFHAVTGDPSALYRALTASSELRPYLFYDAEGSLVPVWTDP